MNFFPYRHGSAAAGPKTLQTSVQEAGQLLYMLKVDFVTDLGLADEGERPIERRFDELVYRSRMVDPEVDWPMLIPPMERFEVSYPVQTEFQDKRLLHEALEFKVRTVK